MKYDSKYGKNKEIAAKWYCTSENGELMDITDLSSFSSSNKFYFAFHGKLEIEKIHSITLKQAMGKIRARLVLSDEGGGGQNLMIYYANGEEKENTDIALPIPSSLTVTEIKDLTQISLTKIDKNNKAQLTNARFVLKNLDTGKYAVNGRNTTTACTWTTTINNATLYQTGDKITTETAGKYQFYEVQAHSKYYQACSKTENGKLGIGSSFSIAIGDVKSITLENQPRAFLIIKKIDGTTKKELNNTRFIIKKQNANQYAKGGKNGTVVTWTSNIREAEWYAPKQEVCFSENVTCEFYEVQRENSEYEECSIDKPLKVGNPIKLEYRQSITATITNKRKYIKVSGYVWEDRASGDKGSNYDNVCNERVAPDKKLGNIRVTLKDKSGNTMGTTTTQNTTGKYIFDKVEIDKIIAGAYVEFTYNGMAYKSVEVKPNLDNGSKASDEVVRGDFNNKFTTITKNQATASNGATTNLLYKQSDGTSTLNYEGGVYGYNGQKYPVTGVAGKYLITARTTSKGLLGQTQISSNDIYTKEIKEIANINLGIVEKEQPDLSLVKDIDKIEVDINGKPHIYKYADRFNPKLYAENGGNGYEMNSQVKFGTKYGGMSYTRALYASDIYHNEMEGRNPENDLQVKVTYKIGIKNTSSTLTAVVNEIDDYYNNKYKVLNITKQENGNTSKLNVNTPTKENNEYNKTKINNMNLKIKPNGEGYVFVELEIEQDKIIEIIDNKSKLDNIAEISSYSIKDRTGKAYAGIDQDSNPGNIVIGQTNTYEDDTDKAPGLELTLQEPRKVNGKVFLDSTTGELKTGEIREGDGEYKEEER